MWDSSGTRVDDHRAPSWSWAAVDGMVVSMLYMTTGDLTSMVEVKHLDVLTNPKDDHKTGQIIDADLKLFGRPRKFDGAKVEAGSTRPIKVYLSAVDLVGQVDILMDELILL